MLVSARAQPAVCPRQLGSAAMPRVLPAPGTANGAAVVVADAITERDLALITDAALALAEANRNAPFAGPGRTFREAAAR